MNKLSRFSYWRILSATILMIGALWAVATNPWNNQTKSDAGRFDGEWQFTRLLTHDVKPILDEWRGATLVVKKEKASFRLGREITEYDFSPEFVNENPTLVFRQEESEIIVLYDLNGNKLLLSYLPHAVPTRLDKGIVVEFKRRR